MSVNQRLQKVIDELFDGNKRLFSRTVGIAATVTENIVGKRQTYPSYEITSKILSSLENIDARWLLTGKGTMLKEQSSFEYSNSVVSESSPEYGKKNGVFRPFLSSVIGIQDGFTIGMEENPDSLLSIPFVEDYDFSVRHHGESMVDKVNIYKGINDQDVVACRLWKNKSHIRWGEIYVILTREGYTLKKVMPSDTEGKIKCVSLNEQDGYTPYELSISDVLDWAIVVGIMSVRLF